MRIIELFGGIGACTQALKRLGVDVEVVDYVEIDKYAVKSYNAINGTDFQPQDITKWYKHFDDIDLIMHGSPCQDISVAGKQAGADEGSGSRSSLMYETLRIVADIKPKLVLWENVKNLVGKKHKHNFDEYIRRMEKLGYESYWQVLNTKDYGIPQNRERVFTISIRNDINPFNLLYHFEFPKPIPLQLCLADMLEDQVDEKYYLSDQSIASFIAYNQRQEENGNGFKWEPHDRKEKISKTIITNQTRSHAEYVKEVGFVPGMNGGKKHQSNTVYNPNAISRSIQARDYKGSQMIKLPKRSEAVEEEVLTDIPGTSLKNE